MSRLFRFWNLSRISFRSAFTPVKTDFVSVYKTHDNTFEGSKLWAPYTNRPAFGGQLAAQSLAAGMETVSPDRYPNILHTVFCNPGDLSKLITYSVESLKEGKTMSIREVTGSQEGTLICKSFISAIKDFDRQETYNYKKETIVGDSYIPLERYVSNELTTIHEHDVHNIPEGFNKNRELIREQYDGIMSNILALKNVFSVEIGSKINNRRQAKITFRKDTASQQDFSLLLTLLSDLLTVETALLSLNLNIFNKKVMIVCSMDHNINFVRAIKPENNVVYYLLKCDNIFKSKAIIEGKIVNEDGEVLCTTNQQGLVMLQE